MSVAKDQKHAVQALKRLCAFYGRPLVVESEQEAHFTRQEVQMWAKHTNIQWKLHAPYNPQAAGMTEWYNRLLKRHLWVTVNPPGL